MCNKLENELEARWLSLGDENDELNQLYEKWARNNFSTYKTLSQMKAAWDTMENPENVGILIFVENKREYIVAYPVLEPEGGTCEPYADPLETNEPTVLLAESLFNEDNFETITREQAELAGKSYHEHFVDYLSVLFKDRHGKIAYYKQERIKSNQRLKNGKVDGKKITLKDQTSLTGCLGKLKGTIDYIKNKRKEIVASQLQNGTTNLKLFLKVFGGFSAIQSDPIMAMSFLRTKGYRFSSLVKRTDSNEEQREYRLCCDNECDPFKCSLQDYHQTPLDVLSSNKDSIDPLTVSRFVSEKVNAFVGKCIKPIAKDFCLFLMFNRPSTPDGDSSIFLCGHIWTTELSSYHYENKKIPENKEPLIPEILRHHIKDLFHSNESGIEIVQDLVSWPDHLYGKEGETVTKQTLERLRSNEHDNLRETSIFEAIFCSARGMQIAWSNLAFAHINTSDQREVIFVLKKKKIIFSNSHILLYQGWKTFKQNDVEMERRDKGFFNWETKTWWIEYGNLIKEYRDRPLKMEPLMLLQKCVHYRDLKESNVNYKNKLAELRNNEGIEVSTDILIPMVTNRERYPHAPTHLPKYILIEEKILELKESETVLKYENTSEPLTIFLLCEPWRFYEEYDLFERNPTMILEAFLRRKEALPFSSF